MTPHVTVMIKVDNRDAVKGALEMGVDEVDVTTLGATKPNLAWEHVDPAGHFHAWDREGTLPTLDRHTQHVGCDMPTSCGQGDDEEGDCPGYNRTFYVCKICAEVEPIRIPDVDRKFLPGRSWWNATVETLEPLEYGTLVSVVLTAGDGAARYFGVAQVGASTTTFQVGDLPGLITTNLHGTGPLGRKR